MTETALLLLPQGGNEVYSSKDFDRGEAEGWGHPMNYYVFILGANVRQTGCSASTQVALLSAGKIWLGVKLQ